jgi:hypothetical protein
MMDSVNFDALWGRDVLGVEENPLTGNADKGIDLQMQHFLDMLDDPTTQLVLNDALLGSSGVPGVVVSHVKEDIVSSGDHLADVKKELYSPIDNQEDLETPEPTEDAEPPKKRRKATSKYPSKMSKKRKLYEARPFEDPERERNRRNAINAKLNRDRKKKERNALMTQMSVLRKDNEKLSKEVLMLKKIIDHQGLGHLIKPICVKQHKSAREKSKCAACSY